MTTESPDRVSQMTQVHDESRDFFIHNSNHYYSNNEDLYLKLFTFQSELKRTLEVNATCVILEPKQQQNTRTQLFNLHNITLMLVKEMVMETTKSLFATNDKPDTKANNEMCDLIRHEALTLFTKKNTDYGDAFAEYGVIGVIVRIGDKIFRLKTLISRNQPEVEESVQDTLEDLFNYTAMAIMLLDE
jgi:hypothetical protein